MPPSKPVNLQNLALARSFINTDRSSQSGQSAQFLLHTTHFTAVGPGTLHPPGPPAWPP